MQVGEGGGSLTFFLLLLFVIKRILKIISEVLHGHVYYTNKNRLDN